MVEFNPNANYSSMQRKVDDGPKSEVLKQDGNYFVKNADGSYEQVAKTRKGNLFHKSRYSRMGSGTSIEKSPENNSEVNQEARAKARDAQVDEVAQMKKQSLEFNSGITAPCGSDSSGLVEEVVVMPEGRQAEPKKAQNNPNAFEGISDNEYIFNFAKSGKSGESPVSTQLRRLTTADTGEIRDVIDSVNDLAFHPTPQGASDTFGKFKLPDLLDWAENTCEDPAKLKNLSSYLRDMGEDELAEKVDKKIQNLQE